MSMSGALADGASDGGSQAGWPGQSGSAKLAMVEEKTSIRPLGVLRGAPAGSSLKARSSPPSSGSCGSSRPWPAQNSAKLGAGNPRSEEHTSELQSLMRISYAVFCLKKKQKHNYTHHKHTTI